MKDNNFPLEVIMLTADGTAQSIARAMKSGTFAYLVKPFSLDEVKRAIRQRHGKN